MRDLTSTQFNSNSPMRNYVRLSEKIEELNSKARFLENEVLELKCK